MRTAVTIFFAFLAGAVAMSALVHAILYGRTREAYIGALLCGMALAFAVLPQTGWWP